MILTLAEILKRCDEIGIKDKEIAAITGRSGVTVWRWRKNPDTGFDFDDGMAKLIARVNGDG